MLLMMSDDNYVSGDTNGLIDCGFIESNFCVDSYNMHCYNQGSCLIRDVICYRAPDVIMFQEHWLTPHNMSRFDKDFPNYHLFGSSSMELSVEEGPLIGRPFGGTAVLVKNELLSVLSA